MEPEGSIPHSQYTSNFLCINFINKGTFNTVENVILTTKGLQERNIQLLDGTTVENR